MPGMGGSTGTNASPVISAFHSALLRQGALIFAVLIGLFVAWNLYCSWQYRQARSTGSPLPRTTTVLVAEPAARRFLRISFGMLWILDGLLQLQQNMPLGLPSNVLQPAAATSPGWVRSITNFAVDTWTRHPTQAAAAAVWIQLGIGVLLLVAPRGRWSRLAGVAGLVWGLVVWIPAEAFGGIFAPGLTILFGAPGAALFYALAGGLIALPDRAWAGRRLGEIVTGGMGLFLIVMGVVQAWPGRGFWHGGTTSQPGSVVAMAQTMSTTSQPHASASLVSWFGSLAQAHGWLLNFAIVVLLVGVGLALLVDGRYLRPGLYVFAGFALLDWVFVQDFGFWGGTGTDPNSMLPMLFFVIGGYLALRPATATAESSVPTSDVVAEEQEEGVPWTTRWRQLSPRYSGRLAATLGAAVIILVGTAPMVAASANSRTDPLLIESVNGAPAVATGVAPSFHLVDQTGKPVSLQDLRGYTVVLTFLDPVCTTDCPVIAQEMRATNQLLGSESPKVRFVAVVANPTYNAVSTVDAFDQQEGLDAMGNWLYLTGSTATLRSVWRAYGEEVSNAPAGSMAVHADIIYVIDSHGVTRRALTADPGDGEADHQSFSSLLAQEISQVMTS